MKTVTHTLWPVSYINDKGEQRDTMWTHKPTAKEYFVGEPVKVTAEHPDAMSEDHRAAEIAALKARIAVLEGVA